MLSLSTFSTTANATFSGSAHALDGSGSRSDTTKWYGPRNPVRDRKRESQCLDKRLKSLKGSSGYYKTEFVAIADIPAVHYCEVS